MNLPWPPNPDRPPIVVDPPYFGLRDWPDPFYGQRNQFRAAILRRRRRGYMRVIVACVLLAVVALVLLVAMNAG